MDGIPKTGHREALRRLRDVMAGSGTAQDRLDQIVRIVAAEMAAEVCSVYVQRAGDVVRLPNNFIRGISEVPVILRRK